MTTRGRAGRPRVRPRGRALSIRDEDSTSSRISRAHDDETQVEETPLELENDLNSTRSNEEPSSEMRRRGDNLGTQIPIDPDKRPKITVVDSKFIEVDVSRNISNDIKGIFTKAYPKWLAVPDATKNLLWENFKLRYKWDITDIEMRKVWNENAGSRFREILYKSKQKAMKNAEKEISGDVNVLDMVGHGPTWMTPEIWQELVEKHWAIDDYQKKCEQARKNRLTEKDGSVTKHTCGSIPREAHRLRMSNVLKRPVDSFELFERCQRSNRGTGDFVDKKSKRISDEYRSKQGCDDPSTLPSFDFSSWCEVAGGPSKGRLYGIGRSQSFGKASSGSSVDSTLHQRAPNEQIQELSKVIFNIQEDHRRRGDLLEKALEEGRELRKINESLQEVLNKLMERVEFMNDNREGGSRQRDLSKNHG